MSCNVHTKKYKFNPPIQSMKKGTTPKAAEATKFLKDLPSALLIENESYLLHEKRRNLLAEPVMNMTNAHPFLHNRKRGMNCIHKMVVEDQGVGTNIHDLHRFVRRIRYLSHFSFHGSKVQTVMAGPIFKAMHNKTRSLSITLYSKPGPLQVIQNFKQIKCFKSLSSLRLSIENQDFLGWKNRDYARLIHNFHPIKDLKGFTFSNTSFGMNEDLLEHVLIYIQKHRHLEKLTLVLPEIERFHTSKKVVHPYFGLTQVLSGLSSIRRLSLTVDGSSITNENLKQLSLALSSKNLLDCRLKVNNPSMSKRFDILNFIPNLRLEINSSLSNFQLDTPQQLCNYKFPVALQVNENYWQKLANKDFVDNLFSSFAQIPKMDSFNWKEESWKNQIGRKNLFPVLSKLISKNCQDLKCLGLKFSSSEMLDSLLSILVTHMHKMQQLTSVKIDIVQYNHKDGCDELLERFFDALGQLPGLKELGFGISGHQINPAFYKSLFDKIPKMKNLTHFEITHVKLSRALIFYLISKVSKLLFLESCSMKYSIMDEYSKKENRQGPSKNEVLEHIADSLGKLVRLSSLEIKFPFSLSDNQIKAFEERLYYKNKKLFLKMSFDVLAFLMNM